MEKIYIYLLILVVIIVAVKIIINKSTKKIFSYRYQRKDFLMSRGEHEFFDILIDAVGDRYYIFPQIHLPTILNNKITGQNWHGAFRHIDEKSVDFVLCDKAYIKPLLVIELDDYSHGNKDRQERDEEVERILKEAGLPLLRFKNQGHIEKEEVVRRISEALLRGEN